MKPNPIEVGQRIKEIRIKKGLSQKEFAKKTNSTIPAISNWENGRNLPNKERLKAIAELGEMSVDELLYGKGLRGDFPNEYGFIKNVLEETLPKYNFYSEMNTETKKNILENLIERYLLSYIHKMIIDKKFYEAIDEKDFSLLQSFFKHTFNDEIFFQDDNVGFVRYTLSKLYDLSSELGTYKGQYEHDNNKTPNFSEEISDILNEAYSSIYNLLDDEEKERINKRLHSLRYYHSDN